MTSDLHSSRPEIRRLWRSDKPALVGHFQRLDPATRRLRFGGAVKDRFVREYAEKMLSIDSVIFGAFADGNLRGVAELRGLMDSWPRTAEAALSVEREWQEEGIGDALLTRLISAAQNRGIVSLHMMCLRENRPMQHLARKHSAVLNFDLGDVEATLGPPWPTPISMFREMYGDTQSYLHAIFDLSG